MAWKMEGKAFPLLSHPNLRVSGWSPASAIITFHVLWQLLAQKGSVSGAPLH